MISTQGKLALDAAAGGSLAAAQHIVIKHFIDKPAKSANTAITKLQNASPAMLPGLTEVATLADFVGAGLALGYELYKGEVKKKREITDVDMALITYGATAVTEGVLNMIFDPPSILGSYSQPVIISPGQPTKQPINPAQTSIYGSYSQ